MHSLEEIEKVKAAHNIIVADLQFCGEYDIDIIREKISIVKSFLGDKKIATKMHLKYIKFLELVYFYFEYDTLQNRKFIIALSKNIDSAINSAISNSTKQSRTFSNIDTEDDTVLKRIKESTYLLDPLDLLVAGMLQNVWSHSKVSDSERSYENRCNFTTIKSIKKITKQ
jgi:hypothetical protein